MFEKLIRLMAPLGVVLFAASVSAGDALLSDFAAFDRAFIPPLALTNQEKVAPSKKAIEILKTNWAEFKARHYKGKPKDPKWKQDLDRVESKILESEGIILTERDLMDAHEILESIRFALMGLRKRNGIDYYLDHLSEFHEHMEAIVHTASERDAGSVTEKDRDILKKECAEAVRVWDRIQDFAFDQNLFGFNEQKETRRKELIKMESQALSRLQKALERDDPDLILKSAKEIRPHYAALYKLFGDFRRVGETD